VNHEKRQLFPVTAVMMSTLCACETMKTLGKNMEDGGEEIQKKAS
jgi:predicted small secreted protein